MNLLGLIINNSPYGFVPNLNICNCNFEIISLFDPENTRESRRQGNIECLVDLAPFWCNSCLNLDSRHGSTKNFVVEFDIKTLSPNSLSEINNRKIYKESITEI